MRRDFAPGIWAPFLVHPGISQGLGLLHGAYIWPGARSRILKDVSWKSRSALSWRPWCRCLQADHHALFHGSLLVHYLRSWCPSISVMDPHPIAWIARPTAPMSPNSDPTAWIPYGLVCAMHVDSLFSQLHVGSSADSSAVMQPHRPWKRAVQPKCHAWMRESVERLEDKREESIAANQKRQRHIAASEEKLCSGAGDPMCML